MRKELLCGVIGLVLGAAVFGAVRTNAQTPIAGPWALTSTGDHAWKMNTRTGEIQHCDLRGEKSDAEINNPFMGETPFRVRCIPQSR